MLNYRIIKPSEFLVHEWSGGTTAEIFLLPETADYRKKDFEIRISSARILKEGTPYSDFRGFSRLICPIEGEMHIQHMLHHQAHLKTFEVDCFDGAWHTQSFGLCTDFNLLFAKNWKALMQHRQGSFESVLEPFSYHCFFSCSEKLIKFYLENSSDEPIALNLETNDFLVLFPSESTVIKVNAQQEASMVYLSFARSSDGI